MWRGLRNSRGAFSPLVNCVNHFVLYRLNKCFFSLFVSGEPLHCEPEDSFFSVFHTQIPPENYENCVVQTIKKGMFNLCDYIDCHKRMLDVYGNSRG